MSTDDIALELAIPQGTRDYAGELVIGVGGVFSNPPSALLSVSDRRQQDREAEQLLLEVGAIGRYDGWQVTVIGIYRERDHDFARLKVEVAR
jgi:hypothetical protein